MAILPIVITGDPVLHTPAAPVAEITTEIRTLVADMYETMDAAPGVGLAAPQIGVGLRIFVYTYEDEDGAPWRGVVINPELWMTPPVPGDPDEDEEVEGCLSVPGERFALRRSENVIVTGTDLEGAPVRIEVDGWRARIMQHEFDHLNGTLYVDRLTHPDDRDELEEIIAEQKWGVPGLRWMPGVDNLEG